MTLSNPNTEALNTQTSRWSEALTRSIPLVYGMFVKRGLHPGLAEELTQKTVFDAVRGRSAYDPERGPLEAWLVGIARKNLALEMRQRATRMKVTESLAQHLQVLQQHRLPDSLLERQETVEQVRCALNCLSARERDVLELKYLQDLSARTIARNMQLTEKAVHSLLYRARLNLRARMIGTSQKHEERIP